MGFTVCKGKKCKFNSDRFNNNKHLKFRQIFPIHFVWPWDLEEASLQISILDESRWDQTLVYLWHEIIFLNVHRKTSKLLCNLVPSCWIVVWKEQTWIYLTQGCVNVSLVLYKNIFKDFNIFLIDFGGYVRNSLESTWVCVDFIRSRETSFLYDLFILRNLFLTPPWPRSLQPSIYTYLPLKWKLSFKFVCFFKNCLSGSWK